MKKISSIILLSALVIAIAGCSYNYDRKFFKSDPNFYKVVKNNEYVADVVVNKEGWYLLGFIPFSSGSEEAAKERLYKNIRKYYPESEGVYDYQVVDREENSLIDWTPSTAIWAKVYVKGGLKKKKKGTKAKERK